MRRRVITIFILLLLALSDMFPKDKKDDSYIIRKAYIDTLGIFPTVEEMDWYCVYNTDSYPTAVDYLSQKSNKDPKELKSWLLSEEYQQEAKAQLSSEELDRAICYFTGEKYSTAPDDIKRARLVFLSYAKLEASSDLDVIDNMANMLMSRTTKKDEANYLLAYLNKIKTSRSEEEAWLLTIAQLLTLEDICSK